MVMMAKQPKQRSTMALIEGQDWNALLQRVGSHQDREAFSALFAHFAPLLKGFLMKGSNLDPEQAEELVQETMIKVWRKAPSYSSAQAAASTWMYTIARNTRIDWLRKHAKISQQTDELIAEDLFDENEDGTIDARDLREVFVELGHEISEDDCKLLVKLHDTDGDGKLNFQEFVFTIMAR